MRKQIGVSVDPVLWNYFKKSCKLNKIRPGQKVEKLIKDYLKTDLENIRKKIGLNIKKTQKDLLDLQELREKLE